MAMRTGNFDFIEVVRSIKGVLPSGRNSFPLHEPEFSDQELRHVRECIESGWVSYLGSHVERFEDAIANVVGRNFVISTVSGTAGLHLSLVALGVGEGDEVLTPALTFVATANSIALSGATPNFIDSDPETLGVDVEALKRYLLEVARPRADGKGIINRKTGNPITAIMPVHILGHPTDDDEIAAIARSYGLDIILDATESLGSRYKDVPAARNGLIAVLSFNGNKIITTGGGGAVLTDDMNLASRLRHIAATAQITSGWNTKHDAIGFNYRMPALNAALGLGQIQQLDNFVKRKRRLADLYRAAIAGVDGVKFVEEPCYATSNYWLNAIYVENEFPKGRDDLLKALHDEHILCRPAWTPMHMLEMYKDVPRARLTGAEEVARRLIQLPSGPGLVL
tara:strand:- start:120 stop:1307 length:1188 start_codon:yes stop_codon:yes gene_type:complete